MIRVVLVTDDMVVTLVDDVHCLVEYGLSQGKAKWDGSVGS